MSEQQPLPVLREDGSTLDWTEASYEVAVQYRGTQASATVRHTLKNAQPLLSLIEAGSCLWATEVRCPRTLFSRLYLLDDPHQEVIWNAADAIWEHTYLVCGIVATRPTQLEPEGLNHNIWTNGKPLHIPPGWWLAISDVMQLNPLLNSLLVFDRDPRLSSGQMRVEEDTSSAPPRFKVLLAGDIHAELYDRRDLQIAGLIAAFSQMTKSTMRKDGERAEHPVTEELRRRLRDAIDSDWDDDDFDPARAATAIEVFEAKRHHDRAEEAEEEDDV